MFSKKRDIMQMQSYSFSEDYGIIQANFTQKKYGTTLVEQRRKAYV